MLFNVFFGKKAHPCSGRSKYWDDTRDHDKEMPCLSTQHQMENQNHSNKSCVLEIRDTKGKSSLKA